MIKTCPMKDFGIETSNLYRAIKDLKEKGCVFQYYEDANYSGRTITINNRELIHFANCSYLGLEKHPFLIEASVQAVREYGTQNSMSRAMLSSPLYKELEDLLRNIFPGYQAVFPTTTLAHCSALPLLIQEKDAIILDAYVHNSVRMASQLCKANGTFVLLSKHNDMEHVKYLIYRLKKEGYRNISYCADGIYSIHGNLCNVEGVKKLLDENENFYAYIDDAHGIGWHGKNGSGYVIGDHGLHEKIIVVASFAKSMAASGGVVIAKDPKLIDYIKLTGQTMIFSGPIQPAVLGSLIASVKLHLTKELTGLQNELNEIIQHFRNKAKALSLPIITKDLTPIQLLRIGNMKSTYEVQKHLISKGFLSTTAGYPAISEGDEGIRISLTRHLTKSDIDNFLNCLKDVMVSAQLL